jgi:hypothetical protein
VDDEESQAGAGRVSSKTVIEESSPIGSSAASAALRKILGDHNLEEEEDKSRPTNSKEGGTAVGKDIQSGLKNIPQDISNIFISTLHYGCDIIHNQIVFVFNFLLQETILFGKQT